MAPPRPKWATCSEESLNAAVNAVSGGRLSTHKAAVQYGIPRTIGNHLLSGVLHKKTDRNAIFTPTQEKDFVNHIIKFSEIGIPLTPKMIRVQGLAFCDKFNIAHNFNRQELQEKAGSRIYMSQLSRLGLI